MRHSAATIALEEEIALAVVQELLSHSGIRVTRGYTHVSSPLAQDAAARLGRALFGKLPREAMIINALLALVRRELRRSGSAKDTNRSGTPGEQEARSTARRSR